MSHFYRPQPKILKERIQTDNEPIDDLLAESQKRVLLNPPSQAT